MRFAGPVVMWLLPLALQACTPTATDRSPAGGTKSAILEEAFRNDIFREQWQQCVTARNIGEVVSLASNGLADDLVGREFKLISKSAKVVDTNPTDERWSQVQFYLTKLNITYNSVIVRMRSNICPGSIIIDLRFSGGFWQTVSVDYALS
jgi:hypothetical protein